VRHLTGPGGAGVTVSEATAQMFDPADPDRPVKAFLQEYQTLFGFGPIALDERSAVIYTLLGSCRQHVINPFDYLKDVFSRLPAARITQTKGSHQRHGAEPKRRSK
jgi:IS66 C-terminal element